MANILKRSASALFDIEETIFQSFNSDFIKKITLIGNNIDVVGTLAITGKGQLPLFKGFILRRVSNHCLFGDSDLETLEGSPRLVGGSFNCSCNGLVNLIGAPIRVTSRFTCYGNNLKTLEGAPKVVGGDFNCSNNPLISLKGISRFIGGDLFYDLSNLSKDSTEVFPDHLGGKIYTTPLFR